jgi:hypothetical protein
MLEKIQQLHEANLKLAGDNEVKLQQYLDGLTAIEMQLKDENEVTAVDGDPKGLGGGGIRNPR